MNSFLKFSGMTLFLVLVLISSFLGIMWSGSTHSTTQTPLESFKLKIGIPIKRREKKPEAGWLLLDTGLNSLQPIKPESDGLLIFLLLF